MYTLPDADEHLAYKKRVRMNKAVAYYRVSTKRQGESGLGLTAQENAIKCFVKQHKYTLSSEFVEIESGKRNDRPVLFQALELCRRTKATLLIAKLDRLGRNVAFISTLMESGVEFKATDNPYADKLLVHIMAAIAEHERDRISERTREALQVAKAKGTELGKHGKYVLSKQNRENAQAFALSMEPRIVQLAEQGITSIRKITKELNKAKAPTFTKTGKWHPNSVCNLIKRINAQKTQSYYNDSD